LSLLYKFSADDKIRGPVRPYAGNAKKSNILHFWNPWFQFDRNCPKCIFSTMSSKVV